MLQCIKFFVIGDVMKIKFKVQLHTKQNDGSMGPKVAIQRLNIQSSQDSIFSELTIKIVEEFKELKERNISVDLFWKDDDNDYVRIHNNDSLVDAMEEMGGPVFTLYASCTTDNAKGE